MPNEERARGEIDGLFRVVAGDIHFWIPFVVLVAGLALLHQLR